MRFDMPYKYRITIYHQEKAIGEFETNEKEPDRARDIIINLLNSNSDFGYSLEVSVGETRILESSTQGIKIISKSYEYCQIDKQIPEKC